MTDELVLAELRLIREQLAALAQEIRGRKRTAARRVRTVAQRNAALPIAHRRPTAEEVAKARRALLRGQL